MNIENLVTVSEPYISSVDFKTVKSSTIGWASVGEVDTKFAREFAIALLNKADALDYSKLEIAPSNYWSQEFLFEHAKLYCFSLNIDGNIGWRLPTVYECEIIRKQAEPKLLTALKQENWVYTSTEPFYDEENHVYGSRSYEMQGDGPVTTYGFEDDEYDFEDLDSIRVTMPVRDV